MPTTTAKRRGSGWQVLYESVGIMTHNGRFLNGYLVGEMIMAPTWCFLIASSNRSSLSTTGIRNAKVFPLPVTACRLSNTWLTYQRRGSTSTTTSLCVINRGIVEAWTGVILLKPMLATASIIHSASEGVKASHARDDEDIMMMGANRESDVGRWYDRLGRGKNSQCEKREKRKEKQTAATPVGMWTQARMAQVAHVSTL